MSGYREIARQFVRPMGVSAPAARAASLATQAENVEAEDPEWAARLEAQAVQARGLVLDLVAGAVHQQFPGLSEEAVDYWSLRFTGQIMRDAYKAERGVRTAVSRG